MAGLEVLAWEHLWPQMGAQCQGGGSPPSTIPALLTDGARGVGMEARGEAGRKQDRTRPQGTQAGRQQEAAAGGRDMVRRVDGPGEGRVDTWAPGRGGPRVIGPPSMGPRRAGVQGCSVGRDSGHSTDWVGCGAPGACLVTVPDTE